MFPEMRSTNLKMFSKLFLIPGFWILINGLAAKLPHCLQVVDVSKHKHFLFIANYKRVLDKRLLSYITYML